MERTGWSRVVSFNDKGEGARVRVRGPLEIREGEGGEEGHRAALRDIVCMTTRVLRPSVQCPRQNSAPRGVCAAWLMDAETHVSAPGC